MTSTKKLGGSYEITSDGKIFRTSRSVLRSDGQSRTLHRREMSCTDDGHGYRQISVYDGEGKRVCHKLHRLVAQNFLPNPLNKRTVNHKDGDKNNNTVDNLEWATDSENEVHAYRTALKECMKFEIDGKIYVCFWDVKQSLGYIERSRFYRGIKNKGYFIHKGVRISKVLSL